MNQDTNNPHSHDGHEGHNHDGHNHDGHNHAEHTHDEHTHHEQVHVEKESAVPTPTPTTSAESAPADNVKLFSIVGYVLPFLFFLPLVQDETKHNATARFHANQQLILLILWIAVEFIFSGVLYSMLPWNLYSMVNMGLQFALLALAIIGILNAVGGKMKELPLVGGFKLIDILFKS